MSTSYSFLYKDRNGLLSPITLDEWAAMVLTPEELSQYNTAKVHREAFQFNPVTYFVETKFPYGSSQTPAPLPNSDRDFSGFDESTLYKLFNFANFLVDASIADAASKFNVDMSVIPADQLNGYTATLKAWAMMLYVYWAKYESPDRPVANIAELALKFNGANATDLGLDKVYPFLTTTQIPFPDLNWEQWWDRFLADPNVEAALQQ